MSLYEGKIYDGKSVERLVKSTIEKFTQSSTLKDHGLNIFNDAAVTASGAYLEQQLTYIVPKVLKRKFPNKPSMELFTVSNEGALEKILVRRIKTFAGLHQNEMENKSNPSKGTISVAYDATGQRVESYEATSMYKELDLLRAAVFNDPLDASIIEAHDESYKTVVDRIALLGMVNENQQTLTEGLLNNSNVLSSLTKNATAQFSTTSNGIQIYNDIATLYNAMLGAAAGNQELYPDTLISSPTVIAKLHSTTYGAGITGATTVQTYKTVAQMLQEMLGINKIVASLNCVNLDGTGTTDRLVLFNRQADNMTLYLPKPLTFSEVQKLGFNYKIDSVFRAAGLAINQSVAFGYLKGC